MKIGIIGLGFVGEAMYKSFILKGLEENKTLFGYDKFKHGGIGKLEDLLKCDILFTALPTQFDMNTEDYDTTALVETCEYLFKNKYNGIVVNKSTVTPGTTEKLALKYKGMNIIHNPEFLSAKTAFEDFHNQTKIVLGITSTCSKEKFEDVVTLYKKLYPTADMKLRTSNTSEMMKISANTFYAMEIQYCNELYEICQKDGIKYDEMIGDVVWFGWITGKHVKVPGPDGQKSYGNFCFPKDTNALCCHMKRSGTSHAVLEACIKERNTMRTDQPNIILKRQLT